MASHRHAAALALGLVAVLAVTGLAVGAGGPTAAEPTPTDAAATTAVQAPPAGEGAGFTDCTNGTSRAMLACGYAPGPTAVELTSQVTGGETVTVRAVNVSAGGFVAIHRRSFVDGAVIESFVGTSGYLDAGLHRDVRVPIDAELDGDAELVAVVYRDDGDERFEFVSSGGATDRPYTNSYSPAVGNVSDEAGDVIGDLARVRVASAPAVVDGRPARDLDEDGRYEDVTGDGQLDMMDVAVFLERFEGPAVAAAPAKFDFNDDGRVNILDVAELLDRL